MPKRSLRSATRKLWCSSSLPPGAATASANVGTRHAISPPSKIRLGTACGRGVVALMRSLRHHIYIDIDTDIYIYMYIYVARNLAAQQDQVGYRLRKRTSDVREDPTPPYIHRYRYRYIYIYIYVYICSTQSRRPARSGWAPPAVEVALERILHHHVYIYIYRYMYTYVYK